MAFGDLVEAHVIHETEDEDAALARGELGYGLPNEGHLFAGDETRLDRAFVVGEIGGGVGGVDGVGGGALPEAEALGAGVVAEEIDGDAHEPAGDGALVAEAGAGVPGAEEGVLGEGVGGVGVAGGEEEKTEDSLLVKCDDGVDVVEGGRRGFREGEAGGV